MFYVFCKMLTSSLIPQLQKVQYIRNGLKLQQECFRLDKQNTFVQTKIFKQPILEGYYVHSQ